MSLGNGKSNSLEMHIIDISENSLRMTLKPDHDRTLHNVFLSTNFGKE